MSEAQKSSQDLIHTMSTELHTRLFTLHPALAPCSLIPSMLRQAGVSSLRPLLGAQANKKKQHGHDCCAGSPYERHLKRRD